MKIFLTCFMIMLLHGIQNHSLARNIYLSFAVINPKFISDDSASATIIHFTGVIKKERVLLYWTIDKNQEADKFEVERSFDGKNFVMTGLVFGTDQTDKVDYQFFEKNKKIKVFYRLKIIKKDLSVEYSAIISPEPFPSID
ncbi:MAG: hypothetical protein ACXWWC_00470 [Chitinophagaceae bacterium]